jgi:hypothetical protein
MLTIGVDSYITVEQADEYVDKFFVSSDKQRTDWDSLSEADKTVHLSCACSAIESVAFIGVKLIEDQTLSFPRCYPTYNDEQTPEVVKQAQAFEALELCSPSQDSSVYKSRVGNKKSFHVTGLSETMAATNCSKTGVLGAIISSHAIRLLSEYAGGGYDVY